MTDEYGSYGSVAKIDPSAGPMLQTSQVRASPDAFGAQIGEAMKYQGKVMQKVGEDDLALVTKWQGKINETLANNAEAKYLELSGEPIGQFKSLTGVEAAGGVPVLKQQLMDLRNQIAKDLPGGAAQAFDTIAAKHEGNYLQDAHVYAADQVNKGNMDSWANMAAASATSAGTPAVAYDDHRFGEHLGTIEFAHQMQLGDVFGPGTGLKQDPKTGVVHFDESTQEGKEAKVNYKNNLDYAVGVAWENRLNTVALSNPVRAMELYKERKDAIPKDAQVRIETSLTPRVVNAHAADAVGSTINLANQDHRYLLLNPPQQSSAGSYSYNMGNVKTSRGSQEGIAEFVNPATPVDGAILAANNLRKNYVGLSLGAIGNKWAPAAENKTSDWVNNVSKVSGIAVDEVPDLNNPEVLGRLLKGIATAEKSPEDRANFTDEVIAQAAQSSISGKEPASNPGTFVAKPSEQIMGTAATPYAANVDGSPITQADYYASHKDEILVRGDQYAEQRMPGSLQFKTMVRERLTRQMEAAISAQGANYRQDNKFIQRAITGEMTKGQPPNTYEELRAIPGVAEVLDRAEVHSPEYTKGIDTQIAKMARREVVNNSPNGYDTVMRVLQPYDAMHPNAIYSQDHLDKLLGRSDGTGINAKDYNDAKKAIEYSDDWKEVLHKNMQDIERANGNVDGQGKQRAMDFYNTVARIRDNKTKGGADLTAVDDVKTAEEMSKIAMQYQPSRAQQVSNVAKDMRSSTDTVPPPSRVTVISPEGQTGTIPADQLDEAIKSGYKRSE